MTQITADELRDKCTVLTGQNNMLLLSTQSALTVASHFTISLWEW